MDATVPLLESMNRVADPLADRTVAAIFGPWNDAPGGNDAALKRLARATRLMAQWDSNAGLAGWNPTCEPADAPLVAALREYLAEGCKLPDWTHADQVTRAGTVFMQEGPLSCVLLFCASLPECYVPPRLAEVLHVAGQLEAHTEHRIRQTAAMVFPVMLKGGLTTGAGCGVAQVLKVRLIHATIRHLILHGNPQQAAGVVATLSANGQPDNLHAALMGHGWDVDRNGLPCNQLELAYTLLTFSYVFLRCMRTMGLGLPPADERAVLHIWNVAGHVLGVRDELMAHDYDEAARLFERMRDVARTAPGVPDPRPALGRALMNAMASSVRLPVLRSLPLPMTQWLIGRQAAADIGILDAAPAPARLLFTLARALTRAVDASVRCFLPQFSISRTFTRVVGYRLLSRFLLDQTRPLTLPDQVLNPMREAVAQWHHEPRAPGWLNWLEDALTVNGPWIATTPKAHTASIPARPEQH